MDVLANLRTFLAVARHGGFSEAARQLHVVPSVVAKRIAQLEKTMFRAHLARRRQNVARFRALIDWLNRHLAELGPLPLPPSVLNRDK